MLKRAKYYKKPPRLDLDQTAQDYFETRMRKIAKEYRSNMDMLTGKAITLMRQELCNLGYSRGIDVFMNALDEGEITCRA